MSQNLKIYAGQSVLLVVTMDPPVDPSIAGWSIRFRLRPSIGSNVVTLSKTVGSGITITGDQTFEVLLTSAETLAITVGNYAYDIWRTDSGYEGPLIPNSVFQLVKSVNYG